MTNGNIKNINEKDDYFLRTKVAIIGAGQMGMGIAQYLITQGVDVILIGQNEVKIQESSKKIHNNYKEMLERKKISIEQFNNFTTELKVYTNLSVCENADFIIEAIPEDLEQKINLIEQLNKIVNDSTIIATNTSSFSITKLGSYYIHPKQFIGLHFFNPVIKMPLVEVVKGLHTSESAFEKSKDFINMVNKHGVEVLDNPGFIVNRILIPMINEAIFVLQEGVATIEEIDISMKLGTNHPMGPLALADYIGLDTCLAIMENLHKTLGEDKYRPALLLKKYVAANKLGIKNKVGFYSY